MGKKIGHLFNALFNVKEVYLVKECTDPINQRCQQRAHWNGKDPGNQQGGCYTPSYSAESFCGTYTNDGTGNGMCG